MSWDPRTPGSLLWTLLRWTGGTDAWSDPVDNENDAAADRRLAVLTCILAVVVVLALIALVLQEGIRAWVR